MKIKAADKITPKDAAVYRKRNAAIKKSVKKIETEMKVKIKKVGDLVLEQRSIETALAVVNAKAALARTKAKRLP